MLPSRFDHNTKNLSAVLVPHHNSREIYSLVITFQCRPIFRELIPAGWSELFWVPFDNSSDYLIIHCGEASKFVFSDLTPRNAV